jgi:hypothetical protein
MEISMTEERKPTLTVVTGDKFDPNALRIGQDFMAKAGVTRLLTEVPVQRPHRQWWIRCHPSDDYRLTVAMIELKDDSEYYVVIPPVARQLPISVYYLATLQTSITRQGTLFLWPLRNSGSDGKDYGWWRTGRDAALRAQTKWINIASNKQLGAYDISEAIGKIPEPEWPDYPMSRLMAIAFKDRLIDTIDHPVLRQLQGKM